MSGQTLDIGVVTDEVSLDLEEALAVSWDWGIRRFELRAGSKNRFPYFTDREVRLVDEAVRDGAQITAVSPGILKGSVKDEERLQRELEEVLPRAIQQAHRFECQRIIVFGFSRHKNEPDDSRARVLKAFEEVTEQTAAADLTVAVENEPNFWIDRPEPTVTLLEDIDHPALTVNWDPANQHWGAQYPNREGFEVLRSHISNVHAKDYTPDDPDVPWRPIGDGGTPWKKIIRWIIEDTDLSHITLETHCKPLIENSRASLEHLRDLIEVASSSLKREPNSSSK
jgi:sugar phosphate isomerase/epimerase